MTHKILFCATVDYHFKAFHLPYLKWFKDYGWDVDVAAAGTIDLPYIDNKYNLPIDRSPFNRSNIVAYRQLKEIIDQNDYDIIHCHTPIGGFLARIAGREARKKGTKVIYTAHGFHFCKGGSIVNWLIYYPIERYLSRLTDSLITINEEDYNLAKKHRFRAKVIEYVNGVGVDTEKFKPINHIEKLERRKSFGYKPNDFLLFSVGEFNKNKNQQFLLHSMVYLLQTAPNVRLVLAGDGPLLDSCKKLVVELNIEDQVDFLGFRKDIEQWMPMCDVAVSSSLREGLPVNIMEAMACGLPIVGLNNRGNRELVTNDINGWTLDNFDNVQFANKIRLIVDEGEKCTKLGENGRKKIINKYSEQKVLAEKVRIYKSYMAEQEDVNWKVH